MILCSILSNPHVFSKSANIFCLPKSFSRSWGSWTLTRTGESEQTKTSVDVYCFVQCLKLPCLPGMRTWNLKCCPWKVFSRHCLYYHLELTLSSKSDHHRKLGQFTANFCQKTGWCWTLMHRLSAKHVT